MGIVILCLDTLRLIMIFELLEIFIPDLCFILIIIV
jgi:hypothetical protein